MKITDNRVPLSTGSPIQDYSIVKALAFDDISIHYRALSTSSNRLVTLTEFFPAALATRHSSFRDLSATEAAKAETLQSSIQNFARICSLLLECEHPNLNRTMACLHHGGTVLSVHEKLDAPSLLEYQQQRSSTQLDESDIQQLITPILQGVQCLHNKGIVHLDLQPKHIFVPQLSAPVITHFAQAQCIGQTSTLSGIVSLESVHPYLAPELLSKKSELNPASDIYALGMTLYSLMTGLELPLAQDRLSAILDNEVDPLPELSSQSNGYSDALIQLVTACVQLRQKDRPQSITEVLAILHGKAMPASKPTASNRIAPAIKAEQKDTAQTVPEAAVIATPVPARTTPEQSASDSPRTLQYSAGAAAALLLVAVTYVFSKPSTEDKQLLNQHHSMERLAQLESQRLKETRQLYQLVTIPAGNFIMGCSGTNCPEEELPTRTIEVPSFQMMAHQVTFAMWDACVEQGGCNHRPRDEGWGRGNRPVMNVSYQEIVAEFIPWLNQASRQSFRLPSEVEWEYAARAGQHTPYQFGESISCEQGRFGRRSGGECSNQLDGTAPVMSYSPNAFGLYDMHGNVWEWTQDCWNADYQQAVATTEPRLSGNCVRRVLRGGTWLSTQAQLSVSHRSSYDATLRHRNNGFRLMQPISANEAK
ncbi:SUMF1/EgtB/PvdO family nonheme iron enzyme [Alkalimonas sp. NCh-2]|uniref:SUMF1/EgtB/PvdO family nonheme iron enzyme n=1 Tax=Alkalimonas sp. NCh-2 TaxID=3144846 RepID=UPI0031F6275D